MDEVVDKETGAIIFKETNESKRISALEHRVAELENQINLLVTLYYSVHAGS